MPHVINARNNTQQLIKVAKRIPIMHELYKLGEYQAGDDNVKNLDPVFKGFSKNNKATDY